MYCIVPPSAPPYRYPEGSIVLLHTGTDEPACNPGLPLSAHREQPISAELGGLLLPSAASFKFYRTQALFLRLGHVVINFGL